MSLPEEESTIDQAPVDSQNDTLSDEDAAAKKAALTSIAPAGVLEKMFKMPVVKQLKERKASISDKKAISVENDAENLFVKPPATLELIDTPTGEQNNEIREPTESFVLRHLKPGTSAESIEPSYFYHDIAAIELDLYTKYLRDEISLQELEETKSHMAAVNVQILRREIIDAQNGETLNQTGTRIVKELEIGNLDPFMAEALIELINIRRRKLAGFSRRLFLQECDIRKMCEDAYAKTAKYVPEQTHHWTISKAFESLEKGQSDFALQILTLTREIDWPEDIADLFWRKLRLSTFRHKAELTLEEVQEHNNLLEKISREMKQLSELSEEDIKSRWDQINRNEAIQDLHEDLWCHGVAEGMRITTGNTHNDMAEKSGLPVAYDYSRFDPVTMWFLVGLHKKDSSEFHKYVIDSEKSGYNFWLSYVKNASSQSNNDSMKSGLV
jgi:hypothetical protein